MKNSEPVRNESVGSINQQTSHFIKLSRFTRTILRQHAALPLGGGDGAVTSVPSALDEVGLLHRENAILVGQINAEIPRVK